MITKSDFRIPSLATSDVSGATVTETVPRGKHLLTRLDNGLTLHTHLKMEGSWAVNPPGTRWHKPAHTARVVLRTSATEAVGFAVILDLVRTSSEDEFVGSSRADLLGPTRDASTALARLSADPAAPIGDALLDQRNLAGIGNVYKAERPRSRRHRPAHSRRRGSGPPRPRSSGAKRLLEANKNRWNRVTTGDLRRGHHYWVYGRRGPCLRCGTRIAEADEGHPASESRTYWCPTCQTVPPAESGPNPVGRTTDRTHRRLSLSKPGEAYDEPNPTAQPPSR